MITLQIYWMNRDITYAKDLTPAIVANATALLPKVNGLLQDLGMGEVKQITSGWRPPEINAATVGAAKKSSHMIGKAVDIFDPDGEIDEAIMAHPELLTKWGLNHEDPSSTPGWCHVDDRDGLGFRTFKI